MSRLGVVLLCGMVSSISLPGCEMRTKPPRPNAASPVASAPANATSQPDGGAGGGPAAGAAKSQPTSQPAPPVATGGQRWSGGGVSWVVPAGWEQKPGGGMRAATLVVEGLEITVIPLAMQPVDANVNRWRGQIGLGPASAADIAKNTLKISGRDATFVDETGNGQRLLGLIMPYGQQMWFFKVMGDEATVSRHKDEFEDFVKSIQME